MGNVKFKSHTGHGSGVINCKMPALKVEQGGVLHCKSSPFALRVPPLTPSFHYGARGGRRLAGRGALETAKCRMCNVKVRARHSSGGIRSVVQETVLTASV